MKKMTITVNGTKHSVEVDDGTFLCDFLRDTLGLTGTHIGCDTGQCGACAVLKDGKAVKSCCLLALSCNGCAIQTVEGLATNGEFHPMQDAFKRNHGLQCGFCTPGMMITGIDIVNRRGKDVTEDMVRQDLDGNLCRCTGYHNIVASIMDAAKNM